MDCEGVPSSSFATRPLFGLPFVAAGSVRAVAAALLVEAGGSSAHWRCVVTPNVDHLVRYRRHADEAVTARRASTVLPDGMPVVWASRLLGRPLAQRLTGADLFAELWSRLVAGGVPVVVVAATDEVARRVEGEHPAARALVPPMFDVHDERAVTSLLDDIDAACAEVGARFLVVGVSMPKHHLIGRRLHERWGPDYSGRPTVLLVGAAPDFAFGLTPRAPVWMQRVGAEWLYRLAREPRRLAKRYLVDDVQFVGVVARAWREQRAVAA